MIDTDSWEKRKLTARVGRAQRAGLGMIPRCKGRLFGRRVQRVARDCYCYAFVDSTHPVLKILTFPTSFKTARPFFFLGWSRVRGNRPGADL